MKKDSEKISTPSLKYEMKNKNKHENKLLLTNTVNCYY